MYNQIMAFQKDVEVRSKSSLCMAREFKMCQIFLKLAWNIK